MVGQKKHPGNPMYRNYIPIIYPTNIPIESQVSFHCMSMVVKNSHGFVGETPPLPCKPLPALQLTTPTLNFSDLQST